MHSTPETGQARAREFRFTDDDFRRVRRLIHGHAGIFLSPTKLDMVYSRLARRLRIVGMDSFGAYLDAIEEGDKREWEEFINSLTTNLTSFFREPHHFAVLSELLMRADGSRPLRIWCSASSTGEEPYSIAMAAVEACGSLVPPVRILASDLDTGVLKVARNGIYPVERVENIAPARLKRFFLRGSGPRDGEVRVKPELRAMVSFRRINLLDADWPVQGPLDAIFCRNVMIYFDKATQLSILERFAPLLSPEGLLFMGHSESLHYASHLFQLKGDTVYRLAGSREAT